MDSLPDDPRLEQALLRDAQAGDADAFMRLIARHDERLRALAYRLTGDREAMDDVLQTAYLRAFRALASFGGRSTFATWLFRIVYRAAIDEQRSRARRPAPAVPDDVAADARDAAGDGDDLAALLASLPHDQRAAVLLVDAWGFDYADAARVLDVAEGTIASRLSRARTALRATLAAPTIGGAS